MYKNGFAVCDSIFAVFTINTKTSETCLGFDIAFVILKFPVCCFKPSIFPLPRLNKCVCMAEDNCPCITFVPSKTKSWSLVIITLQLLSAACQIKLVSFSIWIFNSILCLEVIYLLMLQKNEYLLRGISQFTVDDVHNSAFLAAKPLL